MSHKEHLYAFSDSYITCTQQLTLYTYSALTRGSRLSQYFYGSFKRIFSLPQLLSALLLYWLGTFKSCICAVLIFLCVTLTISLKNRVARAKLKAIYLPR